MINRYGRSIEVVPSGKYVISGRRNTILEAFLGSCVGVALRDRDGGIGGMIHLLLPEPTGAGSPWRVDAYASTGFPMFLRELLKAGAAKERLEACIAGGALVVPTSSEDLYLDIGGRIVEIVHDILRREKIPIRNTETGGYFSCRLTLDLKRLEWAVEPLGQQPAVDDKAFVKPDPEEIGRRLERIRPIPQVVLKIARMIREEDYRMADIAGEIKQDQVISARVIQLSNSCFIGAKRRVGSIDRALVILGEKIFFKVIISAAVEQYFGDSGNGYSLCKGGIYRHALGTAVISEELARFIGLGTPDIAYTAGLLHDIGKVVLDQHIASVCPLFYRRMQSDHTDLYEAERTQIGITHTEAGGLLAEKWGLPENLVDSIREHHYPEKAAFDPELVHLVYVADLLMNRFRVGQQMDCVNTQTFSERLKRLGLNPSHFPMLVELIPERIFDLGIAG